MVVNNVWEEPGRKGRVVVWLGVAGVVALVVIGGVLAGAGDEPEGLVVEDTNRPPPPSPVAELRATAAAAGGDWDAGPSLSAALESKVVWTGRDAWGWSPSIGLVAFDPFGPSGQGASRRSWRTVGWPMATRAEPVLAWVPAADQEPGKGMLFVWGGRPLDSQAWPEDGALLDLDTGAWRALPSAPLEGRRGALAVWTGEEVLIVGGSARDGRPRLDAAAYDPAEERWRRLPDVSGRVHALEWVDRQAVAVLQPELGAARLAAAFYPPGQDAWREGPALPITQVVPDGIAATVVPRHPRGSRLVLWAGGEEGPGRLWLLDHGARRWQEAPPAPLPNRMSPALAWTPEGLLVWGGRLRAGPRHDGAIYDPRTEQWRVLPEGPLLADRSASAVWTGAESLVFSGSAVVAWRPDGAVPLLVDGPTADVHLATRTRIATVTLPSRVVTSQRVSAIAPGSPQPLAAVGNMLVYGGYPETLAVPAAGGQEFALGRSQMFVPDPFMGRVWLVRGRGHGATVAPFDVEEGAPAGPDRPMPGRWLYAATAYGLLISDADDRTLVWDPDRDQVLWKSDEPLLVAAGRGYLAMCDVGGPCAQLTISHLDGGQDRQVAVHRGGDEFTLYNATFSPDDTRLAVPVHHRRGTDVMIVEVEGPARRISLGDGAGVPQLAWHPTHPWLFVAVDGRLLAIPPDTEEARLVHDDIPEEIYGMVVTDPVRTDESQ